MEEGFYFISFPGNIAASAGWSGVGIDTCVAHGSRHVSLHEDERSVDQRLQSGTFLGILHKGKIVAMSVLVCSAY